MKKNSKNHISPSKAYILSNCAMSMKVNSNGNDLLDKTRNELNGIQKHEYIARDLQLVSKFLPYNYNDMNKYIEQMFNAKIANYKLVGSPDLILEDKREKKVYIYDWKTGGNDVSSLPEEQIVLYAYLFYEYNNKSSDNKIYECSYVNPDIGTSYKRIYKVTDVIEKAYNIVKNIKNNIRKNTYNVGIHCKYCAFNHSCPELIKSLESLIKPEVLSKPVEDLTETQLELVLIGEKIINEIKEKIKTYLTLNPNKTLHGYALTNRIGRRMFNSYVTPEILAEKLKTEIDKITEQKLLSVSDLEKKGFDLSIVSDLITTIEYKVIKKLKE